MVELALTAMAATLTSLLIVLKERVREVRGLITARIAAATPLRSVKGRAASAMIFRELPEQARQVEAVPLPSRKRHSEEWDRFAQECAVSFRSSLVWLRAWRVRSRFRHRLELVEFYRRGMKVGQCAVGIVAAERVFLDRLALRPGCEHLWSECMRAVLAHLGPGRYRYGWHLNLEPCRKEALRAVPDLTVETARPLAVHAVEFSRWPSWETYWADTSSNTRRNAKRGEAAGLRLAAHTGRSCLRHVTAIVRLRSVMYGRKGIAFHPLRTLVGYVADHLLSPRYRLAVIARRDREPLAGFIGYEFGDKTYYTAGGSRADNRGAAWYLQKCVLRRTWERSKGRGVFVMGYVDYALHDETVGGGLLRSRRSLRVTEFDTSIVTFRYEPQTRRPVR